MLSTGEGKMQIQSKPKSNRGAIGRSGTWLLIVAATLAACGSGDPKFRLIETITSNKNPIILEYAPSALAFGSATIRIRLDVGESGTVLYEGKISNDGGDITMDNIQPNLGKGYLWLCLNGVEQEDVSVRIELATGLVIEEERHCSD